MATIQVPFAEFGNGSVRIEVDLNTANRRVSKGRCINNSASPAYIAVYEGGVLRFEWTVAPGTTGEQTIAGWTLPQQPDYWNSITGQYEPDGIDMGGYVVQARWPA